MNLCIYCQINKAITRDHVPPKGLFKKPRPSNLVAVPSCESCNGGFQKDDEYFLTLAMDWRASDSPDGAAVTDSRIRSMNRGGGLGKGLWWPIFDKMRAVEARSENGLYLGETFSIALDVSRLTRTVNRIIRGLHYEVTKCALPINASVASMPLEIYLKRHKDEPGALQFLPQLPHLSGITIGDGVFGCRYMVNPDQPASSFWFLEFYHRWQFVGSVCGTDHLSNEIEAEGTSNPASDPSRSG